MKEPILTVIMSCYNQAKYIRQAIDSVLMQKTNFPFKLVITDDYSTKDNSREIIKEYASRYPDRIEALLNEKNVRYLANILRVKSNMHTEYFTLLDADDYWMDENYLQDAVGFLKNHRDYSVYARNVLQCEITGEKSPYLEKEQAKRDFIFEDYVNGDIPIPQTTGAVFRNVVYRDGVPRIVSEAVGTIHERSFEGDVDRFVMHLAKGKAHYDSRVSGVYRILPTGIWQKLSASEKHLIQALCYADYFAYLERNRSFFVNASYNELSLAFLSLRDEIQKGQALSNIGYEYLRSIITFLSENKDALESKKTDKLNDIGIIEAFKLGVRLLISQIPAINKCVNKNKLHKKLKKLVSAE